MPALHGVLRWLKQGIFKGPSCSPADMKQEASTLPWTPPLLIQLQTRGNKALTGKAYALIADSYFNTLYSFMFYILPWWVGRLSLNAKHCRCYQQSNSQITKQRAPFFHQWFINHQLLQKYCSMNWATSATYKICSSTVTYLLHCTLHLHRYACGCCGVVLC